MSIRSIGTIVGFLALMAGVSSAQMPRVITYHGILTNADGSVFLGTQATVGWQLLSDSSTIVASDVATVQNIRLGAFTVDIDLTTRPINFARPLFLKILFDGEAFTPVRLTAVPYAFFADSTRVAGTSSIAQRANVADSAVRAASARTSQRADTATRAVTSSRADTATRALTARRADSAGFTYSGVPIGTIIAYFGEVIDSIPNTGWLLCKGQSIVGYTQLSLLIGAAAPDLRGMFLRGANVGRADSMADPGGRLGGTLVQKIGSVQADAFASHNHTGDPAGSVPPGKFGLIIRTPVTDSNTVVVTDTVRSGFEPNLRTSPVNIPLQGGPETRPNNVFINWLIKAW